MAKFNYAKSQQTAHRLIDRFGTSGELLKRQPNGSYDNVDIIVVVLKYDDRRIDGTRIKQKDRNLLVSVVGLTEEITSADRIKVSGVTYEIIPPVTKLQPAETNVLYDVQARS